MAEPAKRKNGKKGDGTSRKEISFDYIKGNFFRVIAVDGAFGGIGPRANNIHMAIFSERRAIPQTTVYEISGTGELGGELRDKRKGRTAIVREVEADLAIDLATALSIHSWLGDKIAELAKANDVEISISTIEVKK